MGTPGTPLGGEARDCIRGSRRYFPSRSKGGGSRMLDNGAGDDEFEPITNSFRVCDELCKDMLLQHI